MKTRLMTALIALAIMALASGAVLAACGSAHVPDNSTKTDSECCAAAPETEAAPAGEGAGPAGPTEEQLARCGAMCLAGQIPVAWPHGWDAEYWLRPDSNL